MKKLTLTLSILSVLCLTCFAGASSYSGKEMKQTVQQPVCPQWYGDTEWDVSLWGAYAFTGTEENRSNRELFDDSAITGSYDRFLGGDHAWGGGLDAKYFFKRYYGIGVEGFGLAGRGSHFLADNGPTPIQNGDERYESNDHGVYGALGTFTLRYPIGCSRFAPYVFAGVGAVFNGANDKPHKHPTNLAYATLDEETRFDQQFGGGLEVRLTRHIGLNTDFSWNVVDGTHNNFGMVRSGVNFAF